jgi:hypothetical protein
MPNTNTKAIRFDFHANKYVWSWKLHKSCGIEMGEGRIMKMNHE